MNFWLETVRSSYLNELVKRASKTPTIFSNVSIFIQNWKTSFVSHALMCSWPNNSSERRNRGDTLEDTRRQLENFMLVKDSNSSSSDLIAEITNGMRSSRLVCWWFIGWVQEMHCQNVKKQLRGWQETHVAVCVWSMASVRIRSSTSHWRSTFINTSINFRSRFVLRNCVALENFDPSISLHRLPLANRVWLRSGGEGIRKVMLRENHNDEASMIVLLRVLGRLNS